MNASPAAPLRGDESALYRECQPQLIAMLRRRVGGPEQTREDACSFAWVQLLRHQPDRGRVFAWLYVVACREAWHLLERDARMPPLPGADLEAYGGPDPRGGAADALREAREALAGLPERQRRLLMLHAVGHSYAELVVLDRSSLTAVDRHLRRAREAVREGRGAKGSRPGP